VTVHKLCIWTTAFGFVLMISAFFVGAQFPFPSPDHDAAYIGEFYRTHLGNIRLMATFIMLGGGLTAPVAAVVGHHIKRIEGASSLAYLEIGSGCVGGLVIAIPGFCWATAAFRPDRDPTVTQALHDAGWLIFVGTVTIAIMQFASTGVAALIDRSEQPVFPRWFGYLSFWSSLGLVPSALCIWFKTGPFAWNGPLSLYLAFLVGGPWYISAMVLSLRADRVQVTAPAAADEPVPTAN
jgi:hypothetical protein